MDGFWVLGIFVFYTFYYIKIGRSICIFEMKIEGNNIEASQKGK